MLVSNTADLTKLNDVTATALKLNQLNDEAVGGTNSDDINDISSSQTLSNKTLEVELIHNFWEIIWLIQSIKDIVVIRILQLQ